MGYAAVAGVAGGFNRACDVDYSPQDLPLQPDGTFLVTSSDDPLFLADPSTLRWAVSNCKDGVYIRFATDMTIELTQPLYLPSHTTLDARGVKVVLKNFPIVLDRVTDVIIHNIEIGNIPGDTDIIPIRGSSVVWVDHCKVYNAMRGTIDVVYGSTDVTVSNTYINNDDYTQLLGASDDDYRDRDMRVTLYRNWYDRSGQRQPSCRWGRCHVANCLFMGWGFYTLGGRVYGNIRSERSIYIAGAARKEATPWFGPESTTVAGFDYTPTIRSYGDSLWNYTTLHQYPGTVPPFRPPYLLSLHPPDYTLYSFIRSNAGPQYPGAPATVQRTP